MNKWAMIHKDKYNKYMRQYMVENYDYQKCKLNKKEYYEKNKEEIKRKILEKYHLKQPLVDLNIKVRKLNLTTPTTDSNMPQYIMNFVIWGVEEDKKEQSTDKLLIKNSTKK